MAILPISYKSNIKGLADYQTPVCSLTIGNSRDPIRIGSLGESVPSFSDDVILDPNGVRILFSVDFGKLQVRALARALHPQRIELHLVELNRVIGTIQRQAFRSLGAGVVEPGCNLSCIPPAEELPGPGRCVVCRENSNVFELCC